MITINFNIKNMTENYLKNIHEECNIPISVNDYKTIVLDLPTYIIHKIHRESPTLNGFFFDYLIRRLISHKYNINFLDERTESFVKGNNILLLYKKIFSDKEEFQKMMFESKYFCIFDFINQKEVQIKYSKRKTDGGYTIDITERTEKERLFWEKWDSELEDNYKKMDDKNIQTIDILYEIFMISLSHKLSF